MKATRLYSPMGNGPCNETSGDQCNHMQRAYLREHGAYESLVLAVAHRTAQQFRVLASRQELRGRLVDGEVRVFAAETRAAVMQAVTVSLKVLRDGRRYHEPEILVVLEQPHRSKCIVNSPRQDLQAAVTPYSKAEAEHTRLPSTFCKSIFERKLMLTFIPCTEPINACTNNRGRLAWVRSLEPPTRTLEACSQQDGRALQQVQTGLARWGCVAPPPATADHACIGSHNQLTAMPNGSCLLCTAALSENRRARLAFPPSPPMSALHWRFLPSMIPHAAVPRGSVLISLSTLRKPQIQHPAMQRHTMPRIRQAHLHSN